MDQSTQRPGMPPWLRNGLLVVFVLVVVMIALMFAMGGEHGPGRHGASISATAHLAYAV